MTVKKSKRVVVKLPVKKAQKSQRPKRARRPLHGMLKTVGGMVGGYFGGATGADIGSTAGKLISRITGFGDYRVSKNSISMGNSVPSFRGQNQGVRMCHSEFLTNITGSVGFSIQSFAINPGLLRTFPWLSMVAKNYEDYEMHGLVFMYRPTSGTAISSSSSALGVVVMSTQYDATDPPFFNKQQMESYEFASSVAPFKECIHPVECARRANVMDNLFLRSGPPPAGTDIRFCDMGNFQIATEGMQSAYTVGELWVSYDVSFSKPRIPTNPPPVFYGKYRSSPSNTASDTLIGGTAGFVATPGSFFPSVVPSGNGLVLTAPGYYFIAIACKSGNPGTNNATVVSNFTGGVITLENCQIFNNNTSPSRDGVGTGGNCSVSLVLLNVNAAGTGAANTVTFTGNGMGMGTGTTDIVVFPFLPSQLSLSEGFQNISIQEEPERKYCSWYS